MDELNEFLNEADGNICGVIGTIARLGNDKFDFSVHQSLANILTEISFLRKEFRQRESEGISRSEG